MLHHLRAVRASERTVRQGFEIREHVAVLDVQPLGAAQRYGFLALVNPSRRETSSLGGFEKFAAPAADVQYFT